MHKKAAWSTVVESSLDLERQKVDGLLDILGPMDTFGRVEISGTLDLAALCLAVERAMVANFAMKGRK